MTARIVPGELEFAADGTPASPLYDDVYHSASGGVEQARAVFLEGCELPHRWRGQRLHVVLETGFGIGINFLTTWEAWRADPRRCQRLHFLSIEKHPLPIAELERAQERLPVDAALARSLRAQWPLPLRGAHRLSFEAGRVVLTLFLGDLGQLASQIEARVDSYYLDGFSPAKNPAMWEPRALKALAGLANPDAAVATWSVAAPVRAALAEAGFETAKHAGFGSKRERLVGRFVPRWRRRRWRPDEPAYADPAADRRAVVVGAGLAGSAVAHRLAGRGWQVEIFDVHPGPGHGASGNPAGIFEPMLSLDDNLPSRLSRAGLLHGRECWRGLRARGQAIALAECGVLRLARDAGHAGRQRAAIALQGLPEDWARAVDRIEAGAIAGAAVASGGCWLPAGGWLRPADLCAAWLAAAGAAVRQRYGVRGYRLQHSDSGWRVLDAAGRALAVAPVMVLACGSDYAGLAGAPALGLRRVRGQLTLVPAGTLPPLRCVVARDGYASPVVGGAHVIGASYDFDDSGVAPDVRGHAGNLARLARLLPETTGTIDPHGLEGRVAFRSVAADRLPMIGALPGADGVPGLRSAARPGRGPAPPRAPGLYGALAFASRGIVWAALAAELLASQIEGEPMPVERDLRLAVDPLRNA